MQDNTSLPASIRQRLEMVQNLMNENRPQDARDVFAKACSELARTAPDLCALLMAASMGKSGFTATTIEERHYVERIVHSLFGIPIAEELIPVTTRITTTRTLKLF